MGRLGFEPRTYGLKIRSSNLTELSTRVATREARFAGSLSSSNSHLSPAAIVQFDACFTPAAPSSLTNRSE